MRFVRLFWYPSRSRFDAFLASTRMGKPSPGALLAAVEALQTVAARDPMRAFAYAAKAHASQPTGMWLPLVHALHLPRWFRVWCLLTRPHAQVLALFGATDVEPRPISASPARQLRTGDVTRTSSPAFRPRAVTPGVQATACPPANPKP